MPSFANDSSHGSEMTGANHAMARRVSEFDWSSTSLGPMNSWPQVLRCMVEFCLCNKFPMHIWWGPDLIQIYNDAYIPVLGKRHPQTLGKSAREIWSEIWPLLEPQVQAVMHRGESTWNEVTAVKIERNGFPEDAWFTWSYTPIRDEAGTPCGLFCVAIEDTNRVRAEQERDKLEKERLRQIAREQARSEEALRDSNTLLQGISNSTGDAIFAKDRAGRLRFVNPATLALIGKPIEQVIGKTDAEFLEDKQAVAMVMENDRQIMESGVANDFEETIPLSDGTRSVWFSRKMPYRDANGTVIGLLGISRDITQQKAVAEELLRAKEAAEMANQAKDRLLSVVSHELRTPLNPILAITTHLQATANLPAEVHADLEIIRRNVEQEARIVDDLLNVTRLQRGKIALHHEAVDLHGLLVLLINQFTRQAKSKHIKIHSELGAARHMCWADSSRMHQVFSNLLDNAVKFTPEHGQITARSTDGPKGEIQIEIIDTGIGIDPSILPKLFSPFEQGGAAIVRHYGGLGLGLVIVKGIVDLHGGRVSAFSEGRDNGTSVLIELNAMETVPLRQAKDVLPEKVTDISGTRILLVEDHEDTLRIMRRILQGLGYTVVTAMTVGEAMQKLGSEQFDLLVSDIGLPDGSGLEIMRELRASKRGKGIALSGFGNDDDIKNSKEAGFTEHLVKPVDLKLLDSTLRRLAKAG